jgi:hypothetical protein
MPSGGWPRIWCGGLGPQRARFVVSLIDEAADDVEGGP